jgi:hypothetical protein
MRYLAVSPLQPPQSTRIKFLWFLLLATVARACAQRLLLLTSRGQDAKQYPWQWYMCKGKQERKQTFQCDERVFQDAETADKHRAIAVAPRLHASLVSVSLCVSNW